jgi:hypothetical protein
MNDVFYLQGSKIHGLVWYRSGASPALNRRIN